MQMSTLSLVRGRLSLISIAFLCFVLFCSCWVFSLLFVCLFVVVGFFVCVFFYFSFCFKLGGVFSRGYGEVCLSIIIPDVHPTSLISGSFCCRTVCVDMDPLVFWVLGVDILQCQ